MPFRAVPSIDPIVRTGPLADDVTDNSLEIESFLTPLTVAAGDVLTVEGRVGREFFVILEGRAEIRRGPEIVGTLEDGDFFGELSLLGEPRRTATVVAATDMRLLVANPREFRALLHRAPRLAAAVETAASERRPTTLAA